MIDNMWVMDLPQTITTLVSTRANKRLISKFPNVRWTTEDTINSPLVFPTIKMTYTMSELGGDLEGQDINGVMCMVQVDVTCSKEQGSQDARFVSGVAMDEFKKLRFIVYEIPQFKDDTNDLIRLIFRARRVIGQSDVINENLE